jgi:hypothetical protein
LQVIGEAETADQGKRDKHSCILTSYRFQPIDLEAQDPFMPSDLEFVLEINLRLQVIFNFTRETDSLFQRSSATLQRQRAACSGGSFAGY